MQQSFWQSKDVKIGVAVAEYPKGGAHRTGGEGLLDKAINDALNKEISDYLQNIEITGFDNIKDEFVKRLKENGMDAVKIDEFIPRKEKERNYTSIEDKYHIDYLVVLIVTRYGTIRKHAGFIAWGGPSVLFEVKGEMIDLKTDTKKWCAVMKEKIATININGPWKQPPDYPNITKALHIGMKYAKQFLLNEYFGRD